MDTQKERDEQLKLSRRIISRVESEVETVGTSAMLKATKAVLDKNGNSLGEKEDAIDILGKKIGRSLGIVAFAGLAIYLTYTYLLPAG